MPVKKQKEQLLAEDLFINQGWTGKAIANLLSVEEKTVSNWRTKGEWDKQREQTLAAPHKIKEILLREMQSIADGNDSKVNADALSKLSKVMDTLTDRINPQIVISVLKEFDEWMCEQDSKIAVDFLTWHKLFIQYKIRISEQ